MTRDEVAKACGLEDPHGYIKRTGKGHTVKMLCDAVAAASIGKRVFICAYSQRYASQLANEAMRMALRCKVSAQLFTAHDFEWDPAQGTRGIRNVDILRDHYSGL